MAERFRGYLPVVVDVETGGFDWNRHALLELAAIPIELDADGRLVPG
jgi:ribonuclease T